MEVMPVSLSPLPVSLVTTLTEPTMGRFSSTEYGPYSSTARLLLILLRLLRLILVRFLPISSESVSILVKWLLEQEGKYSPIILSTYQSLKFRNDSANETL